MRRLGREGPRVEAAVELDTDGVPVDDATLTTAAINYGIPRESWGNHVGRLEDAPPFLLAQEERYGRLARTSGLPALLKLAERLLTAPR